jgi:hypothetical protein
LKYDWATYAVIEEIFGELKDMGIFPPGEGLRALDICGVQLMYNHTTHTLYPDPPKEEIQ